VCGAFPGILTATSDGKVNGALVAVMVWAPAWTAISNRTDRNIVPPQVFILPPFGEMKRLKLLFCKQIFSAFGLYYKRATSIANNQHYYYQLYIFRAPAIKQI